MTDTAIDRDRPPYRTEDTKSPVLFIAVAVLASMLAVLLITRGDGPVTVASEGPLAVDQTEFAANTGIWIEHVGLIGNNGLIEIRYRTLDSDLSSVVHDLENPPRIVTSDGVELRIPPHEHSHARINNLGITYNEQLVNLGGLLSRGEVVTVYFGKYELPGVVVQ